MDPLLPDEELLDLNRSLSPFNFSFREVLRVLGEHRASDRVFPPDAEIVLIVIYSVLISSGVVSNALLCFVVARQCSRRTVQNSGPTPRNLYIVNLAIADLGLCLLVMPFTLASLLRTRWTMGLLLCKVIPVAQGTAISVSAGTISAIALDRYYTIVRSPRGQVCRMASCSVAVTITLLWATAVLLMVPLMLYQHVEVVRIGEIEVFEACVERWPSPLLQCIYTLSISTLQFLIPVLVLTIIHSKISAYLSVHLIKPPRESACKRARREFRRNRRTMIILSSIAVVYALSWLPMTAFTAVAQLRPRSLPAAAPASHLLFSACHLAAMSSTVTNPLLYGWLNTNFRRELGSVLGREKNQRPIGERRREQYTSTHRQSMVARDRRISFTFLTTWTTNTTNTTSGFRSGTSRVDHV